MKNCRCYCQNVDKVGNYLETQGGIVKECVVKWQSEMRTRGFPTRTKNQQIKEEQRGPDI